MAEVLAAHQRQNSSSCLCGWAELGRSHPAHQAAALTAAGFGDVREAKAQALREAALSLMDVQEHESRLPGIRFAVGYLSGARRDPSARAAAVRG
jgi:hypothetical protein